MPIISSYKIVNKKEGSVKCIDIIHLKKTDTNKPIININTKLVYGDEEINWKYAFDSKMRHR